MSKEAAAVTYYNVNATIVGIPAYSANHATIIVRNAIAGLGMGENITAQPVASLSPAQLALFERTA